MRQYLTPEIMKQKIPGSEKTIGDMMKEGERDMNRFITLLIIQLKLNQQYKMGKGSQEVVK